MLLSVVHPDWDVTVAAVGQFSSDETNVAVCCLRMVWKKKLLPIPLQRVLKLEIVVKHPDSHSYADDKNCSHSEPALLVMAVMLRLKEFSKYDQEMGVLNNWRGLSEWMKDRGAETRDEQQAGKRCSGRWSGDLTETRQGNFLWFRSLWNCMKFLRCF